MRKILWICGLPEDVRINGTSANLSPGKCPAWGWVLGHLPPPKGIELHVACPIRGLVAKEMHFEYFGAQWHCYRELRGEQYLLRVPLILKIRKLVRKLKPDVVDGWGGETGCGWIATWSSKKAVVNVQGLLRMLKQNEVSFGIAAENGRWIGAIIRSFVECWTYKRAWRLFAESLQSQMGLKRFYGYDSEVIYQPLRRVFLETKNLSVASAFPIFLYIGEMVNRKGPIDLLNAFASMRHREARLIMVGSGPLEQVAKNLVSSQGIANRVVFAKELNAAEIISLMHKCDFFILPSYGDTGPTSLKEALSQGLYPICYDNTGPKEHVERYRFGALGKTGEWKSLVPLMDDACLNRKELRKQGRKVALQIKHDLAPENIWPKILAEYDGGDVNA